MRPSARAVISERKDNLGCTIFVILPYPLPSGAGVQVVHRQDGADEGDIDRDARLRHLPPRNPACGMLVTSTRTTVTATATAPVTPTPAALTLAVPTLAVLLADG